MKPNARCLVTLGSRGLVVKLYGVGTTGMTVACEIKRILMYQETEDVHNDIKLKLLPSIKS